MGNLKAGSNPGEEGFVISLASGCAARIENEYYATDQEHIDAWVEEQREELKAVTDAGLIV